MDYRSVPTFNKNVYSSNGAVVVTKGAREVMTKNASMTSSYAADRCDGADYQLTKSEMHSMRCVVDGLRLIHRDHSHVKDVLAHCVTLETYGPWEHLGKRPHELQLSCHFIISGSVKVMYEMHKDDSSSSDVIPIENVPFDPSDDTADSNNNSITCTHGAGEYLAMLSLEGIDDGIAPPTKICTLEPTELLRIDTKDFHDRLEAGLARIRDEIKSIVHNPRCVLSEVPDDALEKILPHITRQRYPSHHPVLKQGEESDVMFCLAKGRCDVTRRVHVPEARKYVSINLTTVDQYGVFGQECLLTSSPSICTVTTITPCLVLKINRLALDVVVKDHLHVILEKTFPGYPSDEELQKIGHQTCLWNHFKYLQIRQHLMEVGAQRLLIRPKTAGVRRMPLSKEERYPENLRRFIIKGANFEPVTTRIRSAFIRRPKTPNPDIVGEDRDSESSSIIRRVSSCNTIYNNSSSNNSRPGSKRRVMSSDSKGRGGRESKKLTRNEEEIELKSCYVTDDVRSSSYSDDEENDSTKSDNIDDDGINNKLESENKSSRELWEAKAKPSDLKYNPNFMKSAVMVTLETNEIVKKAKAVVEKNRFKTQASRDDQQPHDEDDEWYTSIHREHDRLASQITTDKDRMSYIRRYLDARAKQRQEQKDDDVEDDVDQTQSRDGNKQLKGKDSAAISVGGFKPSKCTPSLQHRVYPSEQVISNVQGNVSYLTIEDSSSSCLEEDVSDSGIPLVAPPESRLKTNNNQVASANDSNAISLGSRVDPGTISPTPNQFILNDNAQIQELNPSSHTVEIIGASKQNSTQNGHDIKMVKSKMNDQAKPRLAWAGHSQTSANAPRPDMKLHTRRKSVTDHNIFIKPTYTPTHTPPSSTTMTSSTMGTHQRIVPRHNFARTIISRKGVHMRPVSAPVFNRK